MKLIFNKKNTGWVEDIKDDRDYQYNDHFGEEIFGAMLPDKFFYENQDIPRVSYQNGTVSCVCNAFCFANAFNSKKNDNNDVFFSWRFPYALIRRLTGGTSFRDNAKHGKLYGYCIDQLMPQSEYRLAYNQQKEKQRINVEMLKNAERYKIDGYFYVKAHNKTELKTAILKSPVILGTYVNNETWNKDIIRWNGNKQFGHCFCVIGWTRDYWLIVDWLSKDVQFKKLDINYPILSAITLRDIPDKKQTTMLKTVKPNGDNKIYIILENSTKQHITSFAQYQEGVRTKVLKEFVEVDAESLENYPDAKHNLTFIL